MLMDPNTLKTDDGDRPVQQVSLHIGFFGFRARADGRTGWAAWKIIRRDHPVLASVVPAYFVVVALLAVTLYVKL
jgi:hypothetical protein